VRRAKSAKKGAESPLPGMVKPTVGKAIKSINDRQCAVKFFQVYRKREYMYYK
jgi:hypothetical protein